MSETGRMTDIDALRQRFTEALAKNQVTILTPLPRRVRVRLWLTHRIDGAAIWLVEHERYKLAIALWRACRMW